MANEVDDTLEADIRTSRKRVGDIDESLDNIYENLNVDEMETSPVTSAPVEEKEYGNTRININEQRLNETIPEPTFEAPPSDSSQMGKGGQPAGGTTGGGRPTGGAPAGGKPQPTPPANPAMTELSNRDKKIAAGHVADLVLDGYEMFHNLANGMMKIKESKLNRMQLEGKIDMNIYIPYEYGKMIKCGDLLREHNEQLGHAFEVSPKFREEVRPLMTNIFIQNGVGFNDMQQLGIAFGRDMFVKVVQGMQYVKTSRSILATLTEETLRKKKLTPEERMAEEHGMRIVSMDEVSSAYRERTAPPPQQTTTTAFKETPPEPEEMKQTKVNVPNTPSDINETPKTENVNFNEAPPFSSGQQGGAPKPNNSFFEPDQSATKTRVAPEPLNADNIENAFESIAQENEKKQEADSQVLNKTNREQRTRTAPKRAGYGFKGAPTKEEREARKQQLISEKIKSERIVTEDAVVVSTETVIKETKTRVEPVVSDQQYSDEPVVIDVPNLNQVGSNIEDIDL